MWNFAICGNISPASEGGVKLVEKSVELGDQLGLATDWPLLLNLRAELDSDAPMDPIKE